MEINTFPFERKKFEEIRSYRFGLNWPVVYLQENGKEMYIGQTKSLYDRSRQHIENPVRARLKRIHVLTDDQFNLSANYDFEAFLIQYIAADGKFVLQNANSGLVNHEYYDRERYKAKLEVAWKVLQEKGLAVQELRDIRNSEFYKYSPYKALTEEQLLVARSIHREVKKNEVGTYIVHGAAGTGKSILALYLLKYLREHKDTKHLDIALVVPMTGLRKTLGSVVKKIPGLGPSSVIGPSDVAKKKYDVLIIDEAHRLRQRVNLSNYGHYDEANRKLELEKDATQLDWIRTNSKQQILFYDERQNVVPADVRADSFKSLNAKEYHLTSQMRVEGGEDYLGFIDDLFNLDTPRKFSKEYEFQIFDKPEDLVQTIRKKNEEHSLARVIAGYAWEWKTKKNKDAEYDIDLGGLKLKWNSTNIDWVNSKDAINEVGCIHTIQGYDLNYAGVIVGPEVSFDSAKNEIVIDEKKYKDINGKRSVTSPEELRAYVANIYRTLLTRGIKGTYVYVVDDKLRTRWQEAYSEQATEIKTVISIPSPLTVDMVTVPILGSAPCGAPFYGEENKEGEMFVEKDKIKPGYKYFILRAEGDSMNEAGIQDGDLILCRQQEKAETGDKVVALLGGENVTIKEYGPRVDAVRLLIPRSSNKEHQSITPGEGDSVQGVVQEVLSEDEDA